VSPDISTYSRDFQALRGPDELVTLGSVLGWQKIRHNWLESKDFTLGLLACQVGDVHFMNAQETSSTVWQGGIADDLITITRVNEGGGFVDLAGGTMSLSAGDVYVSTPEDAFTCRTLAYQDVSVIKVPRARLRRLGIPEAALRPKAACTPEGSPADVLFDLFQSFARRADNGSSVSARTLVTMRESVIRLAAATLEDSTSPTAPGFPASAKAFIDTHLDDPGLSPAAVAAALHVSRRTLYRSFALESETVASYIRTARLRRVKTELEAARGAVSIGDVAGRWGFTNRGQFAKLFQSQFGSMPSEYTKNLR
jgi:AraC-like DNA-binding protein